MSTRHDSVNDTAMSMRIDAGGEKDLTSSTARFQSMQEYARTHTSRHKPRASAKASSGGLAPSRKGSKFKPHKMRISRYRSSTSHAIESSKNIERDHMNGNDHNVVSTKQKKKNIKIKPFNHYNVRAS